MIAPPTRAKFSPPSAATAHSAMAATAPWTTTYGHGCIARHCPWFAFRYKGRTVATRFTVRRPSVVRKRAAGGPADTPVGPSGGRRFKAGAVKAVSARGIRARDGSTDYAPSKAPAFRAE